MWYLDDQSTLKGGYPLPENTIEVAIAPLENETMEEAVRNVIAYMTCDCIRLGIRHIRFLCRSSGHTAQRFEAHLIPGRYYDASILTKEQLYAAFR